MGSENSLEKKITDWMADGSTHFPLHRNMRGWRVWKHYEPVAGVGLLKGIVHLKIKILWPLSHLYVVPNPSVEQKRRCFFPIQYEWGLATENVWTFKQVSDLINLAFNKINAAFRCFSKFDEISWVSMHFYTYFGTSQKINAECKNNMQIEFLKSA